MSRPKILIQLDPDKHPSVFDAVVAIDSEVDRLLQYRLVEPTDVRELVHGAVFTRGGESLRHTAIFVGGSEVARAERLLEQVVGAFFGPWRVSVMMDANGANTTAAAAVVVAGRHLPLADTTAVVLAGTGPVGQRVARLLMMAGCQVRVASRRYQRAEAVCQHLRTLLEDRSKAHAKVEPVEVDSLENTASALAGCQLAICAGAAGIRLLSADHRASASSLQVAIDLNAVPPLGMEGTEATDLAVDRDGVICYGAVGVGGTKMKIHRAAVRQLFTSNELVLDAEEIYGLGCKLGAS